MTILEETSKQLVEAIKDLYIKGKYELEYAIIQLNKFYSNGRVTKVDFEEQCEYYKLEKEKLNSVVVEETENTVDNEILNTEASNNEDETVEENKEEITAE